MDDLVGRLFLLLSLIGINAFFVTAEFSIMAVRRSRIAQLVEQGDVPARSVQYLQQHLERLLSTTQLGITLACLGLGWLGQSTLAKVLTLLTLHFSLPLISLPWAQAIALPFTFLAVAYLQMILGELCPKSVALLYAEPLARRLAPIIKTLSRIVNPFIAILNRSTRWLLARWDITTQGITQVYRLTAAEIQTLIAAEADTLGLSGTEQTILCNTLNVGEVTAAELMIPRSQLIVINETATLAELLTLVTEQGYSRYPVKGESLDDIRGLIDYKDLALPLLQGILQPDSPLTPWIKPIRFVSENQLLTDVLNFMRRSHLKIVMVVDEFGGTAGLLSLTDLIEEIVGQEPREDQEENGRFQMVNPQQFIVNAQINLEELNQILGLELPLSDDYHTLGGFLLFKWQKIPKLGEMLPYENLIFTVESVQGPKLEQIGIQRLSFATVTEASESSQTPDFSPTPAIPITKQTAR